MIVHRPEGFSPIDHSARRNRRYNLQEWFSLEKLLDKNEARDQSVNALSEESVGQSNNGLEANPTTDSSLKPA